MNFSSAFTQKMALISLMLGIIFAQTTTAEERNRELETPHAGISAAWGLLACGESYKLTWFEGTPNRVVGKTYEELLTSLDSKPDGTEHGVTLGCNLNVNHMGYLLQAHQAFEAILLTADTLSQKHLNHAKWGFQESFNFLAEARLLKGNNSLVKGLRNRFKADDDPSTKSQIELLTEAKGIFKQGLLEATPSLMGFSSVLRPVGNEGSALPFLVNNTQGPTTPNEFQRYTELLNRYGMVASSNAKFMFFKNNVKDVDNPPYRNFPGPEDLDLNHDRIQNEVGRTEAAKLAKESASHLYLQSIALASLQSEDHFQDNNGYQIKRQVNDIDRLYQDIQSGFNPLLLAGDFVPYQRVENFLNIAADRIKEATEAEQSAKSALRTYEVDQTTLASELRSQTSQYVDQLAELTGISPDGYDVHTAQGRQTYKDEVFHSVTEEQAGTIGIEVLAYQQALLATSQVRTQITNTAEKIVIEQQRSGDLGKLFLKNGEELSLLQYANTMATCCNVSKGSSTGTSKGTSTGSSRGGSRGISVSGGLGSFSISKSWGKSWGTSKGTSNGQSWGTSEGSSRNPNIEKLAKGQSAMAFLQAIQQADVDAINSGALLKNMALELATLDVSLEASLKAEERQQAVVDNLFKKAERILANYAVAIADFDSAYYNDPAYRMEASRTEQAANDSFETAIELTYYAAKALEYQWSEKFNNPVLRLDGGLPEPLSVSYDPYVRAESVFSAEFAGSFSPNLGDFFDALKAWDLKMRQLRYPSQQIAKVRFSLKDDILGFGQFTPDIAEAKFRSFIEANRILGANPENRDVHFEFTLDIADESIFPAHPNIKVESINLNLVSTASRSVRGDNNMSPALVDLVMLDRSFVRTFFTEYPIKDDIFSYTLQKGRILEQSPFLATVEASIDGYASPEVVPNTQLSNHSPAVSTWMLRIKNNRYNNRKLQFQYLSDIEVELEYSFGKPKDIQFPIE
ncbi:hypothetical protein NBRC116188_21680 [Oceaniserpentilla sp. 4NH20-0058]|uniref:hypothetical protein n=1 Tax=Oceaniserpentilla sp. 4NH20-0058 TaxID=3127660 RepID=UPI003108E574